MIINIKQWKIKFDLKSNLTCNRNTWTTKSDGVSEVFGGKPGYACNGMGHQDCLY